MPQAFAEQVPMQVPTAGIDSVSALGTMQPNEAIYAVNFIIDQGGPSVRPGWAEWATNVAGSGGIRTVIGVRGAGSAGNQDYLFAVTSTGIYDCSSSTASPILLVSFANTSGMAGYCEWDHFTNIADNVILLVTDEVNGYYTFDTSTYTWTQITQGTGTNQISGANPATFAGVRVFDNRVWFVQSSSGSSWYLPVDQIYGVVTQFDWGALFSHGGNLVNLYIFTYGSYLGTYVYLVAISSTGDVVAFTGSDPNQASTWTLSGQWYVGDIPTGRRIASNYGGDLNIICAYGIIQLSSLFFQKDAEDPSLYLTKKIAPAIAADIAVYGSLPGFGLVEWPGKNSLIVTEPIIAGVTKKQFCYNLATNAWTVFNGLDWQHAVYWHSNIYAGTSDGRVIVMSQTTDGTTLSQGSATAQAIPFGILGAFQNNKSPFFKIVDYVKAYFTASVPVKYQTFVQYDFDLTALAIGSVSYSNPAQVTGWDSGVWDSLLWSAGGGGAQVAQTGVQGSVGMGTWVAIACLGASVGNTTLVAYSASIRPTTSMT